MVYVIKTQIKKTINGFWCKLLKRKYNENYRKKVGAINYQFVRTLGLIRDGVVEMHLWDNININNNNKMFIVLNPQEFRRLLKYPRELK